MATIYAIQNKVNKKIYIGYSDNPQQRFKTHLQNLKGGKHKVADMQEDFNKYGDVFEIFILEENVSYHDKHLEYKYMKKYRTDERQYGYNYNDQIAKKITFGKPREIACKTEAEILKPSISIKEKYISEIIELLNKTDDIGLIDLVYKVLTKSEG